MTPTQALGESIVTEYVEIGQERIDSFADVTEDRQWIHTDVARAEMESPFKDTVAHGFLVLALLPRLLSRHLDDGASRFRVNYGFNRVRFLSPVRRRSKVRACARVLNCTPIRNGVERIWEVVLECEKAKIPACVAEWIVRYYY